MIKNINGINFNLESSIVSTTTSSSAAITIMDSVLIPALTLNDEYVVTFNIVANIAVIGDAYVNYYLFWNTGSTVSGAIQLGYYQTTSTDTNMLLHRHLIVKPRSNQFLVMDPTFDVSHDYGNFSTSISTVSGIDISTDSYFIYAAQIVRPAKSDGATTTGYQFTIEI